MQLTIGPTPLRRGALFVAALAFCVAGAAKADPIRHPIAVFAGLDKTTGRIINFDVAINETVQFGTLQVTPRVCNTRPQTETPQTTSFVEVDEHAAKSEQKHEIVDNGKPEVKRIFSGWMFAASPGLHGVEHPVYDVWLVDCKGGQETASQPTEATPTTEPNKRGAPAGRRVVPAAPATVEQQPIGPNDEPVFDPAATGDPAVNATPPKPPKKKKRKKPPPPPAGEPAAPPAPSPDQGVF